MERRLDLEARQYEMLLKQAKLESMKKELDKLSLKEINLSGFSDGRSAQEWTARYSRSSSRDA